MLHEIPENLETCSTTLRTDALKSAPYGLIVFCLVLAATSLAAIRSRSVFES